MRTKQKYLYLAPIHKKKCFLNRLKCLAVQKKSAVKKVSVLIDSELNFKNRVEQFLQNFHRRCLKLNIGMDEVIACLGARGGAAVVLCICSRVKKVSLNKTYCWWRKWSGWGRQREAGQATVFISLYSTSAKDFHFCASLFKNKGSIFHLRNIARVRPFLALEDPKNLLHAFVLSRLDYCNAYACNACV